VDRQNQQEVGTWNKVKRQERDRIAVQLEIAEGDEQIKRLERQSKAAFNRMNENMQARFEQMEKREQQQEHRERHLQQQNIPMSQMPPQLFTFQQVGAPQRTTATNVVTAVQQQQQQQQRPSVNRHPRRRLLPPHRRHVRLRRHHFNNKSPLLLLFPWVWVCKGQ
jgi:hypothetical protein